MTAAIQCDWGHWQSRAAPKHGNGGPALAGLEAPSVAIYSRQGSDHATTPHGKAMLQMAAVFARLERGMIREHVMAGLERA